MEVGGGKQKLDSQGANRADRCPGSSRATELAPAVPSNATRYPLGLRKAVIIRHNFFGLAENDDAMIPPSPTLRPKDCSCMAVPPKKKKHARIKKSSGTHAKKSRSVHSQRGGRKPSGNVAGARTAARQSEPETHQAPSEWRQKLSQDPRVFEPFRRRCALLRSLGRDGIFRTQTRRIREGLNIAFEHNPDVVQEFLKQFGYPWPSRLANARRFVSGLQGTTLKKTLKQYLRYSGRYGLFVRRSKKYNKFMFRLSVTKANLFHVRIADNELEPFSPIPGEPFSESFAVSNLEVPSAMRAELTSGKVNFVQLEDGATSSLLNQIEELAYLPHGVTVMLHYGAQPHLLLLLGENIGIPGTRRIEKALTAFRNVLYGVKTGQKPKRIKEKQTRNLLKQGLSQDEIATVLVDAETKGRLEPPTSKEHFSAVKYVQRVQKRDK
jgi:hypothetical protein